MACPSCLVAVAGIDGLGQIVEPTCVPQNERDGQVVVAFLLGFGLATWFCMSAAKKVAREKGYR